MKRLVVVDTSVRVLYHSILVLSLYFLFAGHNQPGGGFVGGLTAGAAVSFRYVAGGVDEVRAAVRLRPATILGAGLAIATATALVPILFGGAVLEHGHLERDLWLLGTVKASSALPFDIGVYLVVIGLVLMMFEAFGDDVATVEVTVDVPGRAPGPVRGTVMGTVMGTVADAASDEHVAADVIAADAELPDGGTRRERRGR